jgi:hypothetical protein
MAPSRLVSSPFRLALVVLLFPFGLGCKDVGSFTTAPGESYCGEIVESSFVTRGFAGGVRMRLTFDADHLEDAPGVLSTDDKMLVNAPMRPIPELFHDPLSTLQFGEGRDKNLVYMVDPSDPTMGPTILSVLSLMHSGDVEVRLIRGAPAACSVDSPAAGDGAPLFGLFAPLHREVGQCSF